MSEPIETRIVTMVLVAGVVVFMTVKRLLDPFLIAAIEKLKTNSFSVEDSYRLSRYTSAYLVLLFVSDLVKAAAALACALGLWKTFSDIALLLLPPKMLGMVLLIAYCGLASIFAVMKDDLVETFTKSFGREKGGENPKV